jgi:hypothetical protein
MRMKFLLLPAIVALSAPAWAVDPAITEVNANTSLGHGTYTAGFSPTLNDAGRDAVKNSLEKISGVKDVQINQAGSGVQFTVQEGMSVVTGNLVSALHEAVPEANLLQPIPISVPSKVR